MVSSDRPATRLATRLSFLIAGFGIACWAPLVPFAKMRLDLDDASLGILLLCIGIGSVAAMMGAGPLSARYGSKPVILVGGIGSAVMLPILPVAPTTAAQGIALLIFGAALGALDVAMNVHAVEVERAAGRPLMSGFHALFSIGGFLGAALMATLLTLGVCPFASTSVCAGLMLAAIALAWPRLLPATTTGKAEETPLFVRPRGVVVLVAALADAIFLVEGAMLDWSALLITGKSLLDRNQAGLGYTLFAAAMTCGRLAGDWLTASIGDRKALIGGGLIAVTGFVVLLTATVAAGALAGFLLIGLGASNIVPVFFRRAGSQTVMPPALAVGAITMTGYAGVLLGPALIGYAASVVGLPISFWILAGLVCLVPLTAREAVGSENR
jgi:predicted MFS family arabinose efflux permease